MPRYDGLCERCEIYFEFDAPVEGRDDVSCPRCESKAKRVWRGRAPGVAFVGAGWTRNESGWKSMEAERLASVQDLKETNRPKYEKAWENALNNARDWTDADHAEYESAVKTLRRPDGSISDSVVSAPG